MLRHYPQGHVAQPCDGRKISCRKQGSERGMWKGHPAIYYGGGAGHWEISRWKKKKMLLGSSHFQNKSHVAEMCLKAATAQQPLALARAPSGLTEEQRLEAEGSDEVIPVGDQLDLPLVSHLRERGTVSSAVGGGKRLPGRGERGMRASKSGSRGEARTGRPGPGSRRGGGPSP